MLYSILFCFILFCSFILYHIILSFTMSYYNILYHIILYYIILNDPCKSYMALSMNWGSLLRVSLQKEPYYLESITGRLFS